MASYSSISIIYNPESTGLSKELARELSDTLKKAIPRQKIELLPTKYAGHAEKLGYQLAMNSKKPLIISASGDGGYNELINGLMKAQSEGATPIAGVLPAGNANDHFRNVNDIETWKAIVGGKVNTIDLLVLEADHTRKKIKRYAHSYIGLGLTSLAGRELNKTKLNPLRESWIVLKTLFTFKPVELEVEGKSKLFDSLLFNNIGEMSKVLKIAKNSKPDDGKFEVSEFNANGRLALCLKLSKAFLFGLKNARRTNMYAFVTKTSTPIQLDGELLTLQKGSNVTVKVEPQILRCIV